ncbi:phage tail protein [Actinophytocola sp.]|jgi:phage tail-like protein|uniref:phage tail protein n=1 Tax=Actinophytocola sp. TaxID=1872138 RepID=UPI002D707E2A|nr:phage tail protein [Actinophytocola sp.]HYQ69356.1 phage tail protein [Actinophytocola sp.]
MPISLNTMLALTARFHVSVDGVDLGGWARCQGLEVSFNPETQVDGGNYQHETILPGQIKYPKVSLQRAINKDDTAKVLSWLRDRAANWVDANKSGGGGTAQIILFDAHAKEVARWMLRNVYPDSWKGPDLDAGSLGVALEQLVLVHEGFL